MAKVQPQFDSKVALLRWRIRFVWVGWHSGLGHHYRIDQLLGLR
jgi:hypothetical protein